VLGLIVGLAIAVVVALYITRAPTPFVSKSTPPASDPGASQPIFDPNRVLQGKSPGQAVPQAVQPAPTNTAPGQTSNQSQSGGLLDEPQIVEVPPTGNATTGAVNNDGSTSPAQNRPSVAPRGTSAPALANNAPAATAQTKPAPAKPAAPQAPGITPAEANTGYFLQVGAYKTEQDAEQQRARLALQGFESKVSHRDAGGVTYFRVRIGPFAKFDDMNSARQHLSDAGVDTAVIRFTKQ
jgi:cell division protein FtsN